ncbi:SBP domain-containing protein [Dioscorea alata]|uniref:SBP domain-containing protein n=1 Tax=Dioscorea alata TaxID=55571 RepID=A0ACB7WAA4_DIOAL|nr:SBP domain-containing protein [Dioscorea alata]
MEAEVGSPAMFLHHHHHHHDGAAAAKKRDFSWPSSSSSPAFLYNQHLSGDWNPTMWNWDSRRFTANAQPHPQPVLEPERPRDMDEDTETLTLRLGGGLFDEEQQPPPPPQLPPPPVTRPNKRVRSGSPGNHPMCQVDDCRVLLTEAKDYHRRHKVCELHSKTAKALVANQMQRFCQQCSRFHPLSEFDEGKRSCRRRLAGHNRRRRKTQPEDSASRLSVAANLENNGNGSMDILSLLTILARLQGKSTDKVGSSAPDKDHLTQILSKINSLPAPNSSSMANVPKGLDLNAALVSQLPASEQQNKPNSHQSSTSSTMDLLTAFSTALANSSPDTSLGAVSQGSSNCSAVDNTSAGQLQPATGANLLAKPIQVPSSVGAARSSSTLQSSIEVSDRQEREVEPSLPLQLFSSSAEDDSPPKFGGASVKYLSSESSNPMDEQSPSSSPPIAQKLFPLQSEHKNLTNERMMPVCRKEDVMVEASTSAGWKAPLNLFKGPERQAENQADPSLKSHASYAFSSVPIHSDRQDWTGRIIFKLFDKDPSSFPVTLRTQILDWLSHFPSEMESYIRPGCVVLSIYISMPFVAWDELEENLVQRVMSLIQHVDSDFWRSGRFLVQTNKQLASHKDDKVRLCKSWSTWIAPELTSVSPLAVVSGKETSLVLKGRNLTLPGTMIYCTYMGGYTSKEVLGSTHPGTLYDDSSTESIDFHGGPPNSFGRCFIEVEKGFKGNSFPLIIADDAICQELRALESELEQETTLTDTISEDHSTPNSREDILHFLNELGWLFQKKSSSSLLVEFSTTRFGFLLAFSVEHDWPALVKTLLDTLVERSSMGDELVQESLEILLEIHLLAKAVKRGCRNMVNLLLNYSVEVDSSNGSKIYLFPPNSLGPGGVTPLHLAACMQNSADMVDALTNDPQEIGLSCWNSILDDSGHSPFAYALMRNNHAYNKLVARKLVDRQNGQVSIAVGNDETSLDKSWIIEDHDEPRSHPMQVSSCARCVMMETVRVKRIVHTRGLLERPYIHSMLAIAAVCVCVCLFLRGLPDIGSVAPFKWENLDYGPR